MQNALRDNLENRTENYMIPLFWQKGESKKTICENMQMIHDSGIGAVCLESRPHPDFLGEGWWKDLKIIFEEAKRLNMKVWIFDDNHFPTGYAAGAIKNHPDLVKKFLKYKSVDMVEGQKGMISASYFKDPKAKALAVIAYRHKTKEFMDITNQMQDQYVHFEAKESRYTIYFLYQSSIGGSQKMKDYINMVEERSTQVLIDAVYEAHYQNVGEYFGTILQGFFTDEPCFGNVEGYGNSPIGIEMDLPWSDEVKEMLQQELGDGWKKELPCLWQEEGLDPGRIRYTYMNIVTKLYEKNFSMKLGEWCHAHGVMHIGHIIEDNGEHAQLGCGPGHFFRSMAGQDMAGIDVVLGQLLPGMDDQFHRFLMSTWDETMFTYLLGKLGGSLAHIDPRKKGRAMCEVFGAYGWSESLRLMKWILDYMLVRGINYFVPHGFSMAKFPDSDCPPHFYAEGNNPEFPWFKNLMDYGNRMCHLLNGGVSHPSAAVLYMGDSSWAGKAMPTETVTKVLTQSQIDFDVIPADVLEQRDYFGLQLEKRSFTINQTKYPCLIIPCADRVPESVLRFVEELSTYKIPVIYIGKKPCSTCEGGLEVSSSVKKEEGENEKIVPLIDLVKTIRILGIHEIETEEPCPYLRYYRYTKEGTDYVLLVNEHPSQVINTKIKTIKLEPKRYIRYDAMKNRCYYETFNELLLLPFESACYVLGNIEDITVDNKKAYTQEKEYENNWTITLIDYKGNRIEEFQTMQLEDVTIRHPEFSGRVRYKTAFVAEKGENIQIKLEEVYDTARVLINEIEIGCCISYPYEYENGEAVKAGENELVIETYNTLGNAVSDILNGFTAINPCGLLKPVKIYYI